jgi:hypothetical protein
MDAVSIDLLLCESLLAELTIGLDSIYERLSRLFDAWRNAGADESALAFLGQILCELGWWSGRAEAAADPIAAAARLSDGS